MIESLLYLNGSRPDIMQAMGLVVRFQQSPKERHVNVVKRIFKYLQGTTNFGFWYTRGKYFNLKYYTNVNWVRTIDDRKSASGATFFLGDYLVSRVIKNQYSISLFIA